MVDHFQDNEVVLAQFNRLMQELLRGNMTRNTFQPWEIEILLDIDACNLPHSTKKEMLRRYQKAVQRSLERAAAAPMKLSDYLETTRLKRATVNGSTQVLTEDPDERPSG